MDFAPLFLDLSRQILAEADDCLAPVKGKEIDVVPGELQFQLQLEIGKEHHAERVDLRAAAVQFQLAKTPARDVDRVGPDHIVEPLCARVTKLRAHDPGQDQHAFPASHPALGGVLRKPLELGVLRGAEIILEQPRMLSGQESSL